MFTDTTGHMNLMGEGFDYKFYDTPDYRAQDTGRRAGLALFQTYPKNDVQGLATLMFGAPGGLPGKYWRLFQAPQVIVNQESILADILGGGLDSGAFQSQPLISGS